MPTLAGIICIRNGFRLDYCWQIAGQSLLAICDELVLCDCDSDDGTRQAMDDWAARDSRINLVNFPWTDPRGDTMWWPTWVNYARQHAKSNWIVALDADEVLHENSHAEVLSAVNHNRPLICKRYNFWKDAQHLIPPGECCGVDVIRVGPGNLWIPSDYPDPRAEEIMRLAQPSGVEIMHYGFLRKREAFFKKAREVQRIWANDYDKRLEAVEDAPWNWMADASVAPWVPNIVPFTGTHPAIIKPWLIERGYAV